MDLNDAIEFNSFSSSLETQNETGCDSAEVFCGHDTSYNQYRSIFRDTGMHVSFAQWLHVDVVKFSVCYMFKMWLLYIAEWLSEFWWKRWQSSQCLTWCGSPRNPLQTPLPYLYIAWLYKMVNVKWTVGFVCVTTYICVSFYMEENTILSVASKRESGRFWIHVLYSIFSRIWDIQECSVRCFLLLDQIRFVKYLYTFFVE